MVVDPTAAAPLLLLTVADAQAILDYLVTQPYQDVYQLVAILSQLPRVPSAPST